MFFESDVVDVQLMDGFLFYVRLSVPSKRTRKFPPFDPFLIVYTYIYYIYMCSHLSSSTIDCASIPHPNKSYHIHACMWNRLKNPMHVRVPTFRRIEGYLVTATQSITFSDFRYSRFLKLDIAPRNDTSAMSLSSFDQQSLASPSSVPSETQREGPVEGTIRTKLLTSLSPVTHLTILNKSHRHNV